MSAVDIKDNRSHRTRDALIRAAEQLFADQGVEAVSINTITRTAGQNNRNAVQYHFGNKAGLIQAIFDKHGPAITEQREALLAELQYSELSGARLIARAIVEPLLEKLEDEEGEAYLHISAELIASNTLGYSLPGSNQLQITREDKIEKLTAAALAHLPSDVAKQRILLANVLAFHGVSDHARVRNNTAYSALMRDTQFMASNLIDSMAAILETAPSAATLACLSSRVQV